jgi:hypothetical protein
MSHNLIRQLITKLTYNSSGRRKTKLKVKLKVKVKRKLKLTKGKITN